jgi:hypothetical protein
MEITSTRLARQWPKSVGIAFFLIELKNRCYILLSLGSCEILSLCFGP